jgi:outer membrane protein TolC
MPARAQAPADPPDAIRYTLADCLRLALENNLDLVSARKDPEIAESRIAAADARFDGVIGADAGYQETSQDQHVTDLIGGGSTDAPTDSDAANLGASFQHLLEFGGSYDLAVNYSTFDEASQEINVTTGFIQDNLIDATTTGVALQYQMPLLRGFGEEVNTIDVLLAQSGLATSKDDLRLQATLTAKQVEDAYWNLLAARAALAVAHESLSLARDLYELNKKKVEVGTLAPIDITQAESGVAAREEDVIVSENLVDNAEDELRRLLAMPQDDPAWSRKIVPTDRPPAEQSGVDVEAALATALDRRPEVATARRRLDDTFLSERVAKRNVRHSLDLTARVAPDSSDSDFTQTLPLPLNTTIETDRTDWRVGLTYGYPLGNRQAKADYAIATLNREKSEVDLQSVEQDIRVDVRTAARNVESGAKRIAAARANTLLQRKTLEAEQKKFDNGMSTSFEVLRIQTDLSDAQVREIQARLDHAKAVADLERAKGTLLEARGLTIGP